MFVWVHMCVRVSWLCVNATCSSELINMPVQYVCTCDIERRGEEMRGRLGRGRRSGGMEGFRKDWSYFL